MASTNHQMLIHALNGGSEEHVGPYGVIDTHIHLTSPSLKNNWLASHEKASFKDGDFGYEAFVAAIASARTATLPAPMPVTGAIYVQCFNEPPLEEAKWALGLAEDPATVVQGVVAQIPVPDGANAVNAFLKKLSTTKKGTTLPRGLKGGRVVLLGDPAPAPNACLAKAYLDGLAALGRHDLVWEWCCTPEAIPSITTCVGKFPHVTFVLDHLGHNGGGDDFETWSVNLTSLAALPNVVAKLGAIEEWEVEDPAPYLDHALAVFGWNRVMYEGNWFVSRAHDGNDYDDTAHHVMAACERANATAAQVRSVFSTNARRVYKLDEDDDE